MSKGVCLFTLLDNISTFALDCLLITFVFHVQDVGMGDKAVTSFLGSCVPLLQILMEVTGQLVKNDSRLSFLKFLVSKEILRQSMKSGQCLTEPEHSMASPSSVLCFLFVTDSVMHC